MKLSYAGPFFRHERPQAGRYRQFHQLGVEAIGSDSPLADAEAIGLLAELLAELGVPGVELRLGSLGSLDARQAYLEELKAHLRAHEGELAKEVRERIEANPLRAFDSDDEGTRAVMASAPKLVERLEGEDAEHFDEVRALLDAAGVEYTIDPTLVRGLDYYTRTIFSFVCDRLGAQSEIGGGGRYDGLVEQLGGQADACGRLGGGDRANHARARRRGARRPGATSSLPLPRTGSSAARWPWCWPANCASAGLSAEFDLAGRGLKGQLKHADRIGARRVVILEAGGAPSCATCQAASSAPVDTGNLLARDHRGRGMSEFPALQANGYRDTWCGQVLGDRVGREARVAGWVHRRRDHGGLIFIDLRDRTGIVQLVFHPEDAGGAFELGHKLRAEDVLSASGSVVQRSPETVNPDLPTGEVELKVSARRAARRRRDAALPDRGLRRRGGRGRAAAPPLPRPAPRADARGARPPPPGDGGDARVPRRRGLPRHRDAGADPLDARRAPATSSSPAASSRAPSTRCRSRRSCSSSC